MKPKTLLLMGLLGLSSTVSAQTLCPNSGMPMSQDPGCVKFAPPDEEALQSQQTPSQPTGYWEKTWGLWRRMAKTEF